jgi:hypothetical protein
MDGKLHVAGKPGILLRESKITDYVSHPFKSSGLRLKIYHFLLFLKLKHFVILL